MAPVENRLVGTWSFVSCTAVSSDGATSYPWGRDSLGYLTYTPEGRVFVCRMSAALRDRGPELEPGSAEEMQSVTNGFESYCGRYEVAEDAVVHVIELCSTPVFCGTRQTRYFTFDDDKLLLRTAPVVEDAISHVANLVWRRV